MTAVLLALGSAFCFGSMTVAIRLGLRGGAAAETALATLLPALAVCLGGAAVRFDLHGAWPFLLAGLLAPGGSQILFTLAVREVGASRTSVSVGAAPLVAVTVAILFLGEPLRLPLALGAVLIVGGGVLLAAERRRPEHLRALGFAFAASACVLIASRDDLVRSLHGQASPETAAAATVLAGSIVTAVWARRLPSRAELRRISPAGLLLGLSYLGLFEAYYHGRVSVVSPLVGTESLWGVALSALLVRHAEGVGRKLAVGAVLVVAGGALIGATASG